MCIKSLGHPAFDADNEQAQPQPTDQTPISNLTIALLASSKMNTATKTVFLALLASSGMASPVDDYCGFYEESACTRQVGSTTYSVYNDGVFQNVSVACSIHFHQVQSLTTKFKSGPWFGCGTDQEFSLISYGPDGSDGTDPEVCHVFTSSEASNGCTHLDDLGFNTGAGNYYRISDADKVCPSTSKRSTEFNATAIAKRDANYLTFYDDVS